jgi:NAD(P)H dehydrogenase (quinone)
MRVVVAFYSMYGQIFKMAESVFEGAKQVPGAQVELWRVPETLPAEVLAKMGAVEAQKVIAHVPVCTVDELPGPVGAS